MTVSVSKKGIIDALNAFKNAEKLLNSTIIIVQAGVNRAKDDLDSKNINKLIDVVQTATSVLKEPISALQKGQKDIADLIIALEEYEKISFSENTVMGGETGNRDTSASKWKQIVGEHSSESDLKATNPNYNNDKTSPTYNKDRKWRINCQRCVPAYEMRRRGNDVTARPRPSDFWGSDHLSYHPFDVWENPDIIRCSGSGMSDIENTMSGYGDGARAQVVVVWEGNDGGHTFIAEQVNGSTRFVDPQTNDQNCGWYFENVENGRTSFCRIDNIETSSRISDCCRR